MQLRSILVALLLFIFSQAVFAQENQEIAAANQSKLSQARQLLIDGTNLLHLNKNQEAKDKLAQACAIAPDLPQAHHQLGIALAKLGDNEEAANEFSTAISLDPNMAASWLNLGSIYQTSGNLDQAKSTYEEFLKRFPQDKDAGKICNLIVLLNKEIERRGSVPASSSADQSSDINLNSQANINNNTGDYYDEIKRQGAWTWPKSRMPLKIYIQPASNENGALPQFISILKEAFGDWASASNNLVSVDFVENKNQAAIICTWSKDPSKFINSNEAAVTRLFADQHGLNKIITNNQARATCLHEVGHLLGLTAHSNSPGDIMYVSAPLKDTWLSLSDRDKNTLLRLYSSSK